MSKDNLISISIFFTEEDIISMKCTSKTIYFLYTDNIPNQFKTYTPYISLLYHHCICHTNSDYS